MRVFALIASHSSIANLSAYRFAVNSLIYGRVLPHGKGAARHVVSFKK